MTKQRRTYPGFRLWLILLGTALFFWLGREDSDVRAVTALGTGLAGSSVCWLICHSARFDFVAIMARGMISVRLGISAGFCFGALASLFTALLMLLKDLRHGHVFPDYPPALIIAALERLPAWSLAGGLVGLALSLLFSVCLVCVGGRQRGR